MRVFVSGVALVGFALAGVGVAAAQEAAKPAPVMTLDGDAAIVLILIKAEAAADFDTVLAKYREALGKNDNPVRKQQLAGMKFFKSPALMSGNAAYFLSVDPVVKGQEYDITRILTEVFPDGVKEYYEKYKAGYAGRQIFVLNKVQ